MIPHVVLYGPPHLDCPWLVVVFDGVRVAETVAYTFEPDARIALFARTEQFIRQQALGDDKN